MTVIPSLVRWGLSPDADLVYRTLSLYGPQTSSGAARDLGISKARVDGALDELVALGAATPAPSTRPGTRRWQPAPADRVLARVRRRPRGPRRRPARWRRQLAEAVPFAVDEEQVRAWPSRALARGRIAELASRERVEHLTINTEEVFSVDAVTVASPLDQDLLTRGLRVRTLGHPASDGDRSCAYPSQLAALGGEHREADELPMKLMLFDRRVAILAADPTDFEAGAVEISDLAVTEHLSVVFHQIWADARDPRRTGVPPVILTAREKTIVGLLSEGRSEESVAAQLGLSRRSVVYALRALMDRLGVENRFQLALVLGAVGATPLPDAYRTVEDACSDS